MTLTVDKIDEQTLVLRLNGYAILGKAFEAESKARGSELRLLGEAA